MPKSCCFIFSIVLFLFLISCKKNEVFYAEDVPIVSVSKNNAQVIPIVETLRKININTVANGNYSGLADLAFIKDISGNNFAYCHPDVQYFSEGFNGYKYWMVFTPYFGSVGTAQESKRFENPTIVVSNDGINWADPPGIKNPIVRTPSTKESFLENNSDPKQGFWSDPDMLFADNRFNLYYRGSMIRAHALKQRGAKSDNNLKKLTTDAKRVVVRQTSANGVNWNRLEVVFNSNPPYTPKDDHLVSPTFAKVRDNYFSYEVELNTGKSNFKGSDPSYIIQRTSMDGLNFSNFKKSKIVNFLSTPWKQSNAAYSPWHIHVTYVDGIYFLCIAVGDVKKYTANESYLAYSIDGLNFEVFSEPVATENAYRSAIFPMASDTEFIHFGSVIGRKTGEFWYREFNLSKSQIFRTFNENQPN